jgi:hypothetical protein
LIAHTSLFRSLRILSSASPLSDGSAFCPNGTAPAPLPGLDRSLPGAIAGALRAELEMGGVLQAITPDETVAAHDPHYLPAFRGEAAAARRNTADIYGQPGFVHRGSGRIRSIDAATSAASAVAGASIEGSLLSLGPERAVDARTNAAPPHLTQRRPEPRAGIIIERFEPVARQWPRFSVSIGQTANDNGQAENERQTEKRQSGSSGQHRLFTEEWLWGGVIVHHFKSRAIA